jgi:dienelactone hydrolase
MRGVPILVVVLTALAACAPAQAEITTAFDGAVSCRSQADGVRWCGGAKTTVASFDRVPIDVNVALPRARPSGPDGRFPLIMIFHGWGGSKVDLAGMRRFLARGYAVFSMTDRGWGDSCGGQQSKSGACAGGYNHLMDTRYEVRDAQQFAGMLADEGLIDPRRIGAIGGSYGGGISMALAALKDRVAVGADPGSGALELVPWRSPRKHVPMRLAAATPDIPWTDVAYALAPNGRTLDYVADAPYSIDPARPVAGVMKASFVSGLYATGLAASNYALPGQDPDADLMTWFTAMAAGEPYAGNPVILDAVDELTKHHSSYAIDHSERPAPLLISNGFTDDLFPPDEALRFYNRTRTQYPKAHIALVFMDHGHQRGQNKPEDLAYLRARQDAWLDHFVKDAGDGAPPQEGVAVKTQTCGGPSEGPYTADSWRGMSRGEVRIGEQERREIGPVPRDALAPLTHALFGDATLPVPPDIVKGLEYDPVAGSVLAKGACSAPPATPADPLLTEVPGATYELQVKKDFLALGAPTVVADIASPGPESQIAARLIDVAADGSQTLVARGLYRPDVTPAATRQVFQLHPNAYRFAAGHTVRLELLPMDVPYARPSNTNLPVTISDLRLRVPTHDRPDGKQIAPPSAKVVPAGYRLARDYR